MILYFSKTGNTAFLAHQLSDMIGAEKKAVSVWPSGIGLVFLLSTLGVNLKTNIRDQDIKAFKKIIVLGPVWGGSLISPLRSLIKLCVRNEKPIFFGVTCETSDDQKEDNYGYSQVLAKAREMGYPFVRYAEAFSTALVAKGDIKFNPDPNKKVKFTQDNFHGEVVTRLEAFANKIIG